MRRYLDKILTVLGVEYEPDSSYMKSIPKRNSQILNHNEINHVELAPEMVALRRFTGDDVDALSQVIQLFLENGDLNLKDVNECLHNGE